MTIYHVNEKGEPGACSAKKDNCPFGGEANHFASKEAARAAYEQEHESFPRSAEAILAFERREFFNPNNVGNFTIIEKHTGYVLSDRLVLVEAPDDDELEDFYENPSEFLEGAVAIQEAAEYPFTERTMVVEPDTEALAPSRNLYAIDTSKHSIDYEAILDDSGEADSAAEEFGFKLWD